MMVVVIALVVVGIALWVWRQSAQQRATAPPGPLTNLVDQGLDLLAQFYPSRPLSRRALPRRLLRAAEHTVTVGVSGVVLVPTRIRIAVNPDDLEPFTEAMEWLQRDVAEALRLKATANGWVVPAGPHIEIVADDDRPVRLPRAVGRIDAFRADDVRTLHRTPPPPPPPSDDVGAPALAPGPDADGASPTPPPSPSQPEAEAEHTAMTSIGVAPDGPYPGFDLPTVAEGVSIHLRLVSLTSQPDTGERDRNVLLVSTAEPLVVGRSREADLQLKDRQVSARHCTLAVDPDTHTVVVRDQGSTNGTFVDDQRVDEATLTTGTTLRVGAVSWRVELDQVTG